MDNIIETRLNQTMDCDGVTIKEDDVIEVISDALGMTGIKGEIDYIKHCKNIKTGNESVLVYFYDKTGMRIGLYNYEVKKK